MLRTIVAPSTDFAGFWRALEALSATVAPVAETQASLFVALDQTFAAFARVSRPYIQETIEKSPPTLDTANEDLPAMQPLPARLRTLLRRAAARAPGRSAETSPVIAESLHAGVPVLNASPVLNNQLQPTAEALLAFQQSAGRLQRAQPADRHQPDQLKPSLRFIAPAQTTCNYATLLFMNLAHANSGGNGRGNWLNFITLRAAGRRRTARGTPSSAPAERTRTAETTFTSTPIPQTGAPGQRTAVKRATRSICPARR